MVSIRYFCGVGEFCRTKSTPRGNLVSNNDTGAATRPNARQKSRIGMEAIRGMSVGNFASLALSMTRPQWRLYR